MFMQEETLIKSIKSKKTFKFYFFYGDEIFLIDKYVKEIVNLVVLKKTMQFNYKKCFFEDFSFEDLKLFFSLCPLFADRKIFVLKDVEMSKLKLSDLAKIEEIVDMMDEKNVLIMIAKGSSYDIQKTNSFKKLLKYERVAIVQIALKSEGWFLNNLSRYLQKNGFFMSDEDLIFFIRRYNKNILAIRSELEKLFSYVEKGRISRDQILNLTKTQIENNAFLIVKNLLDGDKKKALQIFNEAVSLGMNILQLFGAISFYFLDLYRMKLARLKNIKLNEISKYYDYHLKEFRIKNAYFKCDLYSMERLRKYVILISDLDVELKTKNIPKNLMLEKFLFLL